MGSAYATGLADCIDEGLTSLWQAVAIHLQSNHYPPVPSEMVDPCLRAIKYIERGDYQHNVRLPSGVSYRRTGKSIVPACVLAESFHLDAFIQEEE